MSRKARHPMPKRSKQDDLDSSSASFRSALNAAKIDFLKLPDHAAHIERWLESADDPIWKNMVRKIFSDYPPSQELIEANYR
jgi:hypothetical protein